MYRCGNFKGRWSRKLRISKILSTKINNAVNFKGRCEKNEETTKQSTSKDDVRKNMFELAEQIWGLQRTMLDKAVQFKGRCSKDEDRQGGVLQKKCSKENDRQGFADMFSFRRHNTT